MAGGDFQTTSWGWRAQQFQQQAGEWVELKWSQIAPQFARNLPDPDVSWLGNLGWLLKVIGVVLGAIALWQLTRLILQFWERGVFRTPAASSQSVVSEKQPTVKDWLTRARHQQRRANYGEACRCLYMAMLQRLNDTQVVSNQPGLTDGEYRQLLGQQPRHPSYDVLLETHERLLFGGGEATPETLRQCEEAYRDIEENR
ncbi:MAG: DUF4129 domain-containing protein [Cyanobacteriota bacterium]|nr:DUF4129 domain-containing protein [Cyanobacteriota bacterium]